MTTLDPVTAAVIRDLARKVNDLDRRVRDQAAASQARDRSVEGGAQSVYDETEQLRAVVGELEDGSYGMVTYGGPIPPAPSIPLVSQFPGGATITWDGFDAYDEQAWPDNFLRVNVHLSTVPGETPTEDTLIGSIESPAGGALSIAQPPDVTTWATLVAVTAAGIESAPSLETEVTGGVIPDPSGPSTDGLPPASSPTPEVVPGLGAFYLRWTPPLNDDPLTFEVHVSAVAGFTPDATTLYTETPSYSATVRNLTTLDPDTMTPVRFSYDTPYYFRLVAKDADDPAAPGPEVGAQLVPVTAADMALGTLTAEHIALGTLTGDLFSGNVVMGSTISTGALDDEGNLTGARVEMGPSGFQIYDSAGEKLLSFPLTSADAAYVRAHFDLLSAEVRGNFTMRGTNNQIATGSELTIAAGVTSPSSPPQVSAIFEQVALDTTTVCTPLDNSSSDFNLGSFSLNPSQITGLAWDSAWNSWVVCQQRSNGIRLWHVKPDGTLLIKPTTGAPWVDDWRGYTNASPTYNTLHTNTGFLGKYSNGDWYAWGMTAGGNSEINRIPTGWILDAPSRPPAIGFDAVNNQYMLAQSNGAGQMHVRRFTFNVGDNPNATSVSTWLGETASSRRIHGVYYGPAVHGILNRYAFSSDDWLKIYVYDNAGVQRDEEGTYEEWNKPNASLGFACDENGRFATVDAAGTLTYYEGWNWLEKDVQTHIGMSAYDDDPAGDSAGAAAPHPGHAAGTHETPVGERIVFSQERRARLRITVPETNDSGGADDPNLWRVYYYRGTNPAPAAADFKLVGTFGSSVAATAIDIWADPTGAAPPGGLEGTLEAVNNFPGADPGRLESAGFDGAGALIKLLGSGLWRMHPLSWDGATLAAAVRLLSKKTYQSGAITTGTFTVGVQKEFTITFDVPFDSTPDIVLQIDSTHAPSNFDPPIKRSVSATGFTMAISRRNGTADVNVSWIAVARTTA